METNISEQAVGRKVYRRLMWFIMALFICAYLDRINMSFAALSMNRDLGLTAATFGIASSIFYVMYVIAEIPSNMVMQKVGARLWIPRIMITWGLASVACMFAVGPYSLYALRALVGLAEAGFMPAILLYMTYWFPEAYRARAMTMFIMAQPITIVFGSALSGVILEMNGVMGLAGWQWLFILTGIPSVVFGIIAFFYLSNGPADAKWLTSAEKVTLQTLMGRGEKKTDADGNAASPEMSIPKQLLQLPVILMAVCYFGLVMSLSSNSTWVPQIVREVMPQSTLLEVGLVTAIPSLVAIAVMFYWGRHSDKTRERVWHVVLPMCLAGLGWFMVALSTIPELRFGGLIMVAAGTFSAQAIFWSLAPTFLSPKARAVGIAAINVVGLLGTTVGPTVIGLLHHMTGGFPAGLCFVALSVFGGAICAVVIRTSAGRKMVAKTAH